MTTVNARNPSTDLTVQIFDKFYSYNQYVPAQEYDAVNSYFQSVFTTKAQAANFTSTMFRIAAASNIPVMELLQQVAGMNGPQLTLTFAYYLNTFQSKSTLLGIQVPPAMNQYIARNIRQ